MTAQISMLKKPVLAAVVIAFLIIFVPQSQAGILDFFRSFVAPQQANQPVIQQQQKQVEQYQPALSIEQAVIDTVKQVSPAVVSIIQTKDVPVIEQFYVDPFRDFFGDDPFGFGPQIQIPQFRQKGTEKREVGGGTGFIISEDGLIVTNKHVVADTKSEYTVLTNDAKKYPAKVLARDPVQDIAVLKITANGLTTVKLGDSDAIQIGQFAVAIGNALGEFRNTVSFGVVSGLRRNVSASGQGIGTEIIDEVIQTDAAINPGNSGGPLLNLKGEVIGINTAMARGAENIGFAIPINKAKRDIEAVKKGGKITYPFLGIRYVIINEEIQKQRNLTVNYGALIGPGAEGEPAVVADSPASKAGLRASDIILELNGQKITTENPLNKVIQKFNPGDSVTLKILRGDEEKIVTVILGERSG